ncbi:MAG: carboxypeptidase-like regulatory domain-containing protein [Terracidiphilus sp.]|jgi:hypothetical protein
MRRTNVWIVVISLLLAFGGVSAFAQANSELTGIVTDPTGAVVAGAHLALTNQTTGFTYTTDSGPTGLYDFNGLNPSNYTLKVTAKNFKTAVKTDIVVNVSQTFRADIQLAVGAENQTVTVEADALTVQTDSNVVSTLISSQQISEIATNNRNFAALAALGLGVSSLLPNNNIPMAGAGGSSFSISANGLRQSHNIWLIDGGESDDRGGAGGLSLMVAQDALAEFTTLASNYPPDYGISSGATFSLSLKSGTPKFHGTAYEFNRNTVYDANDYFNKFNGAKNPRSVVKYNIYGFNIGGPVFIPGLYNTDRKKTFFFVNQEWRKLRQAASTNTNNTLPTADIPTAGTDLTYVTPLFANSDLTKGAVGGIVVPEVIGDPAFNAKLTNLGLVPGQPFPNNKIPHQLFDPNMVLYLNQHILPPPKTSTGQSVESVAAPTNISNTIVRFDHKFNDKWAILGHWMYENDNEINTHTFLGWDWCSYNTITSSEITPSRSAALKLSGMLSSNLLLEASMNWDGNVIDIDNAATSNTPTGWSVSPFFNNGRTTEIPNMSGFGNPYGTGEQMGSAPWHNSANDYEPKVDISYTMGRHAFKYGFSWNVYEKNQQLFGSANGQYSLGGDSSNHQFTGNMSEARCQGKPVPAGCVIGDGIMDGLLGLAQNYSQQNGQPIRHYYNQTTSVYAMDNWHVSPRLSLQLGIRWDLLPQAWEKSNFIGNFNPAHYSAVQAAYWNADKSMLSTGPGFQSITSAQSGEPGPTTPYYLNGIDLAGMGGTPPQLVTNRYDTIQPRIGFSDDLFGNGKTVIRGGFGTFYERLQGNLIYNSATDSPFAITPTANQVYVSNPHTSLVNGATASTPFFDSGEYNMATSFPDPAVAMYSLGVQHELAPAVVLVVQYVGNVAWHQEQYTHINDFPLTTDAAVRKANGNLTSYTNASGQLVTLPTAGQGTVAGNSDSFRTYEGYSGITSMTDNTNGSYSGLQAGLRLQNKWGLSGELDYTYSHAIDIQSGDNSCCTSNPWVIKYDKGSGSYDRRHMLNANYVYKLPFFNKSQGLLKTIAGGWEIAGTFTDETGTPQGYGFNNGGDPIGLSGDYTNRPNVSGKMTYQKKVKGWFDTTKFSDPTPSWLGGANQGFGSGGKDAIVGPGRVNFDTSVYKSFAFTESARLELRFESFNTFNHTQFSGLDTTLGDGNFGWANGDWGPRTMELGGKFIF